MPLLSPRPLALIAATLSLTTCLLASSVDSSDAGKSWENRKTKTVRTAKTPDERNNFGGWAKHAVEGTGFFRVSKEGRKWWLIDPEGNLFFSVGMNSVEPKRIGSQDNEKWAQETYDLLTGAGFNTIGRWSDPRPFKKTEKPIPWCSTLGFLKTYDSNRPKKNGSEGIPYDAPPVFDEEWPQFCEDYAREKATGLKDDSYLLGHFSDNELPFRPDALSKYLELPKRDASHQAALQWMKDNRVNKGRVESPKVQAAFLEEVARRYYETVATALKKADPNHLYIGSRLHGRCISEPVFKGASVCDIVSVNYYHHWVPDREQTTDWLKWSERPFLVGEFYAMKIPDKRTNAAKEGAGFRVLKYEDAGKFYHTYTAALLKDHPNCIGWHWFKYADANENYQKGIVGIDGQVHQPLVDSMKTLNEQAYSLRKAR